MTSIFSVALYYREPGPTIYSQGLIPLCKRFPNRIWIYTDDTIELAEKEVKDHLGLTPNIVPCEKCTLIRKNNTILSCERFRPLFEGDDNCFVFDLDTPPELIETYYSRMLISTTDFTSYMATLTVLSYDDGSELYPRSDTLGAAGGIIYAQNNKLKAQAQLYNQLMSQIYNDDYSYLNDYINYRWNDDKIWVLFVECYPHLNIISKESKSQKSYASHIRTFDRLPYGVDQFLLRTIILPSCKSQSYYLMPTSYSARVALLVQAFKMTFKILPQTTPITDEYLASLREEIQKDTSLKKLLSSFRGAYLASVVQQVDWISDAMFVASKTLLRNIKLQKAHGIKQVFQLNPRLASFFMMEFHYERGMGLIKVNSRSELVDYLFARRHQRLNS